MAKALKIAGAVVAVAGLAIITGGLAAGASLSFIMSAGFGVGSLTVGGLIAVSAALNTAGSLLSPKPKAPATSEANANRLTVSMDLRAFRKTVLGSTAFATDLRDQEWSADQSILHRFVVCASHRVRAIREIWFDDKLAWTATGGVQAPYVGYLDVTPVLEGSAANAINIGSRMGASRRFTGCAYVYFRYKLTGNGKKAESPFASSIPSRVTIVGDGALFYDPRLDSTVPGGSGPMRADDQRTWAWSPSFCRNPALGMLFYLLGWRIQNPATGEWKLAIGKGIPASRIDLPSFITAANLCEEPVTRADGTVEPRYRADGIYSEGDDPSLVLDNLKAAMNAVLDDADGKIRITVLHNDLAAPIGDLTTADVLGEFTWLQTPPLTDSINVIRGGYIDPSPTSLYQLVDLPEVSIPSPDGIDRPQTVNLALVQSPGQGQRLFKLRLGRAQYGGTYTAVFQATAWKYQKGDVIRFTFAPLGWDKKLFRIADVATQVDGTVPMMLREEHPAIYAAYSDERAAITAAAPTSYDPSLWPVIQGIVDAGTTADWSGVSGPGKPQDNATVGAPTGTTVAGRPAENVIADLDAINKDLGDALTRFDGFKADLSTAMTDLEGVFQTMALLSPAVFDIAKLMDTSNAYLRARTTIDGMPIGTVVVETREKTDSAVEDLRLLGARSLNGSAFNLDLSRVMVDGRTSLSQKLRQIEAKGEGDLNARATDLISTIVDRDQASAKRISSLEVTAKGTTAKLGDLDELVASNEKVTAKRFETIELALDTPVTGLKATVQDLVQATLTGEGSLLSRIGVMESSLNRADTGVWARIGTAEQLILSQGKAFGQRLDTLDLTLNDPGVGLATKFRDLEQATLTGTGSLAQRINTMESSLNTPGTGVWARIGGAEQLILSQGKAFAQDLETVNAAIYSPNGGLSAQVAFLRQATVNASGDVEAKAVLALDANGVVSGLVATNNGKFSKIQFKFSEASFIRPDGTLLIRAGSVDAGEDPNAVYMPNVIVDRIRLGTVGTDELAASAIRKVYAVELGSNPALPNATGQRINYLTLYINKSRDESALRISYNMRPRPGRDYAAQFVLGRMPVNSDTKTDMDVQWYWGASAVINGFRSIRMPISLARTFDGIPAGEHLIIVDVIGYGGGNDQGFMEAGSSLYVEEVKR